MGLHGREPKPPRDGAPILTLCYLVISCSTDAFRDEDIVDTLCIAHVHFIPIVGMGKKRRTLIGSGWNLKRQHPLLVLDYWPSAGGLSAVNAIGMQLRDLIKNS